MPLGSTLQGLSTLAVIVIGSVILGHLFSRLRQPSVLGPITLGVVVGTAVNACPESVGSALLSESSRSLLEVTGTAGLLLLMFTVGSELRGAGQSNGTSIGWCLVPCVAVPIALCALAAWPFATRLGEPAHGWLFVGVALGVTAVPVLAKITGDLGIASLPASRAALRIAVLTDAVAWILVSALVIGTTTLAAVSLSAIALGAVLLVASVIAIPRVVERLPRVQHGAPLMAVMVVAALVGAASTQLLGFHPAIGAVIAGYFFPAGVGAPARRMFSSVIDVLLPAFFVSAAMSVPLQSLQEQASWGGLWCVAVLVAVAFLSKLAAGLVYGAVHRWPWRTSAGLGVLLNCRCVTEIAIASVGFQARLIGPFAFAALCAMAIATTAATAPLYRVLGGDSVRPGHRWPVTTWRSFSNRRTRASMASRMGRTASTDCPAGSGSSQFS